MLYKQKNKKYNSRTVEYDESYEELSRQRKLVLAWQEYNINDSYQAIVLKYLDCLSGRDLQKQIERQIQNCYHKSSYYQKIDFLVRQRQRDLDLLYKCCQKMNQSLENKQYMGYDLQYVCDLIDHIRKTSMYISESVWQMFEYFKFKGKQKSSLNEGKYYINIFASFDSDWSFAKQSILKYYIPFSDKFDPLLIQAAKPLTKLYSQNKILYNQQIEELFRINASYLYRLLRAHQRILHNYILTKDLQAILQKKEVQVEQYSYEKALSHYSSSSKADKRSEPTYQNHRPKMEQKDRNRLFNQYTGQEKEIIRFSTEGPKQNQKVKDNRKIIRISQIVVNNHQNQDNQQLYFPKKLQSKNQSQRGVPSSISRQKTINDETYLKKQKQISMAEPLDDNMYLSHDIDQNGSNLINQSQKMKYSKAEKRPLVQRKRSKTLHLPKLQKVINLHHDQSDCLCQQKLKSRVKESQVDISAEYLKQKIHRIIKNINQKYKQLAKKQIRYELSLLGDANYHKMKEKSLIKQKVKQIKNNSSKNKNYSSNMHKKIVL